MSRDRDKSGHWLPGHSPSKPKGAIAKAPAEFRQFLRDFFDKPETREKLVKRIEMDLDKPEHAPTFALKALSHAFGEPPQDVNLNAGNSLRDALLAAYARKVEPASEDPAK